MNSVGSNILIIGWWNTGLSPLGKSRLDVNTRQVSQFIIKSLIDVDQVSFLALGEITENDLKSYMDIIESRGYDFYSGILKQRKLFFDVGAIYNRKQLELLNSHTITRTHSGRNFKIATRLDFKIYHTSELIHFFISHWPSRQWLHARSPERDMLGSRLRDSVNEIKLNYKKLAKIVLLGDYNDEPFDRSLAFHLPATRDRTLAQKNEEFFYNPFWRLLGESIPYSINLETNSICGTYYHKKGVETKWRTFDQIIFSSSFLGKDKWYLNEKYVFIWQNPILIDLIQKRSVIIDHLPILSLIQRENN